MALLGCFLATYQWQYQRMSMYICRFDTVARVWSTCHLMLEFLLSVQDAMAIVSGIQVNKKYTPGMPP